MNAARQVSEGFDLFFQLTDILAGFGLCFARIHPMMLLLPPMQRLGLTGLQKTAMSVAIAIPAQPVLLHDIAQIDPNGLTLVLLALKEGLIGLALGIAVAAPFWIGETMGELIDQQRASQSAIIEDPSHASPAGMTATLLILVLTLIFFETGGMGHLIDGVLASYSLWPVQRMAPAFGPKSLSMFLALFDNVTAAGFVLAGPLLAAMLLGELGLALVSRIAPQLNVFDLSMAMKGIIFVLGLPLTLSLVLQSFHELLSPLMHMSTYLRSFAPG